MTQIRQCFELSEIRKFLNHKKNPQLRLLFQNEGKLNKTKTSESLVNFIWSKTRISLIHHLDIASDNSFKNLIYSRNVFKLEFLFLLDLGQYYWREFNALLDSISGEIQKLQYKTFSIIEKMQVLKIQTLQQSKKRKIKKIPNPFEQIILINLQMKIH